MDYWSQGCLGRRVRPARRRPVGPIKIDTVQAGGALRQLGAGVPGTQGELAAA
jgi:hypothetical protein